MLGGGNVYLDLNITDFSFTHIICTVFRWCGQLGDDLFIVCSAWFLCERSSFRINKVLKMITDSWIISVIGLLVACIFMSPSFAEIIKSLFPITFELNWFVGCYIIYYLIHPLINKAVADLNRNHFRLLIIILFLAYSVIGTIGGEKYYYYTPLVMFICIHLLVLYIKKYNVFEKISDKICIRIIGIGVALIVGWIIILNLLGTYYIEGLSTRGLLFYRFCNPILIILALAFLSIAEKRNFYNKAINSIASNSLIIYLIHGNYFWVSYGKYFFYEVIFNIAFFKSKPLLITIFCIEILYVVIMPILSSIYSNSVGKISNAISEFITKKIERYI